MNSRPKNGQEAHSPWYKEPLMYLVLGLPATVVVAGLWTVFIAVNGADTVLSEPHVKNGLTVERVTPVQQKTPAMQKH